MAVDLTEAEAKSKHVALLQLRGDQWKMEPIPLQTVRPFLVKEIILEDHDEEHDLNSEEGLRYAAGRLHPSCRFSCHAMHMPV